MDTPNITIRRRKYNSISDISMMILDDTNNNVTHDSSTLNASTHSLPNTSVADNDYTRCLQEQISNQKLQLESANEEIEKLSLENTQLKKSLTHQEQTLNFLKQIGVDNSMALSPIKKKTKLYSSQNSTPTKAISNSPNKYILQILHLEKTIKKLEKELKEAQTLIEKLNTTINTITVSSCSTSTTKFEEKSSEHYEEKSTDLKITTQNSTYGKNRTNAVSLVRKKKQIFIIADQQGRGIRQYLQKLIGDEFLVTSLWKPGAKMCDLLSSYKQELTSLTCSDYVIVMGGVNDKSPVEFKYHVESWVNNIRNTNVLICEIPYNQLLNEKKLNYELKFICNRHENSIFVELGFDRFIPNKNYFSTFVCRSLLKEILKNEYKLKIIAYHTKNKHRDVHNTEKKFTHKSTQTDDCTYENSTNLSHGNVNKNACDFFREQ